MSEKAAGLASGIIVGVAVLLGSRDASAFCQLRSCDPDATPGECDINETTGCSDEGVVVNRLHGCVTFGVEAGAAARLGLDDRTFASIVMAAYQRWADVDCGDGQSPDLHFDYVGALDVHEPFSCGAAGLNVDAWLLSELDSEELVSRENGATAGLTHSEFNLKTGEQWDADVELNENWFALFDDDELLDVMLTVATHEAGHALGLAHSPLPDAMMYREYTVTADRQLSRDDIEGICSLHLPRRHSECGTPGYATAALSRVECDRALGTGSAAYIVSDGGDASSCSLSLRGRRHPGDLSAWWIAWVLGSAALAARLVETERARTRRGNC